MKKFIFLLIGFICYYNLFAQEIEQITSINYNRKIVDYSQWNGAIRTHNNRIFVENPSSFHEFIVNENGEMERILQLDTNQKEASFLIDDTRLYKFYSFETGVVYMMVYDITSTPMEYITTIEIPISNLYLTCLDGDYIYLYNGTSYTLKMNKNTFEIEYQINGLGYIFDIKDDVLVRRRDIMLPGYQIEYYLQFYDFSQADVFNPWGDLVHEINFTEQYGNAAGIPEIKDGKLYVMGWDFFVVFDISDLSHITELFSYSDETYNEICYTTGIIQNDLFIAAHTDGVRMFDISDLSNPIFIHEDFYRLQATRNSIAVHDDKLYINGGSALFVIDLLDDYNVISTFGKSSGSVAIRDGYIWEFLPTSSSIIIYSPIDENERVIEITLPYLWGEAQIREMVIKDDSFYIITSIDDLCELFIYSFPAGELLQTIDLPVTADYIKVLNDYIILSEYGQFVQTGYNYIYQLIDNSLIYMGEFPGNMSHYTDYEDSEYLVYFYENNLYFRDINSPFSILQAYNLTFSTTRNLVNHIKKGIISFRETFDYFYYSYNDELELFTNIHNFYFSVSNFRTMNHFNGYSSVNGSWGSNEVIYYRSDLDGLYQIGSYEYEGSPVNSFIYPEENKLLLQKNSSIHLYDITYTTVDTKDDVISNNNPILFSNYPNPFNPSTTISYTLQQPSILRIDIYNIKGQKVKSLINEYKPAGEHNVTWHGTDDSGNVVGSGVYFYRMEVEGYSITKKMVLLK